MEKFKIKKPLNLHKYSKKMNGIVVDWKFIIPLIFTLAGMLAGSFAAKGESALYLKVCEIFKSQLMEPQTRTIYANAVIYLLYNGIFSVTIFFVGLSIYGSVVVNFVPMIFSMLSSIVVYFLYSEYALKGLAYIVMIVLPYIIPSLLSLIILSGESISMSQYLMKTVSKTARNNDYSINQYFKNCIKGYIYCVIGVVLKVTIENLFSGLFVF